MSKLTNLKLEEFSLVVGSEHEPANPAAKALLYKATKRTKENQMTEAPTAPPVETKKTLGAQIGEAISSVLGVRKAQQTRSHSYESTAKSTEVFDNGENPAEPNQTTIVITEGNAVAQTKPVQHAQVMQRAQAAVDSNDPGTFQVDIAKALETGLGPVVKAIEGFDGRLTALEGRSSGSQQVRQTFGNPTPAGGEPKFGEFTKYLSQQAGLTSGQRLTKAVITSGGWSYGLAQHEAEVFIDYIIGEDTLLKKIRTVVMPDKTFNLDKIGLGGDVLVKGTPGVDPGDTTTISGPTQVQLNAKEIIAIVSIGDDTLEDNIEGDAFVQKLLGMVARKARNEIERAAMHGDTAVADTGIMDRWDGWYKLATVGGAHLIEAMADSDRYWPGADGEKATRLIKAIPTKYTQDLSTMAMILHSHLYLDYQDVIAKKGFSEAYQAIVGIKHVPIRSIQNVVMPLLKTNMGFTHSSTPYTDGTIAMLTDLRNLIFGIHRDIRIEPVRQGRKRATDYVITMRADVQIENGDAIGIYNHAKVKP